MNLQAALLNPMFAGLTDPAAILAAGNASIVIATDSTAYTYSGLAEILAAANVDQSILLAPQTFVKSLIGGQALDVCLSSGGVNFSLPGIREILQANLAANPAPTAIVAAAINAMLNQGVQTGTYWQSCGLPVPSTTDIANALAANAAAVWWAHLLNEVINPLLATSTVTEAEIKAAVAAG